MGAKELKEKLENLKGALESGMTPENLKPKLQAEFDKTKAELEAIESNPAPAPKPAPVPKVKQVKSQPSEVDPFIESLLATISAAMSGVGGGADSPGVRAIIEDYLRKDKVKLSELDQSVLDEIKRNQMIILEIPNFPKKIEVSSNMANIPNFFQIIDDVLAGNNVYLIGEAGGGKTYTAEQIGKTLGIPYVTLNCSQYTSPLEILGGQSIEGFKEGKLIDAWRNGKILILDEMPKLDPNTAGLLNDALAKSSKTRPGEDAKINSANTSEAPIPRHNNFAIIATGNIYPNEAPAPQYRGNNQQDLSLLDRFSGSVYYTEFDRTTDENTTRFKFLYDFLIGNYYDYIKAKNEGKTLPAPKGLRTVIEALGYKNLALVSYRTNISFRVGFEYELVRAIAKNEGKDVAISGKTLLNTFKSYMVAFKSSKDTYDNIIRETKYTDEYVMNIANDAIREILRDKDGFFNQLNPLVQKLASPIFKRYENFYVADNAKVDMK